jgi:microcystin-dependent protein
MKELLSIMVPVGAIYPYGGKLKTIPKGFLICDGKVLKKTEYPELFQVIGT